MIHVLRDERYKIGHHSPVSGDGAFLLPKRYCKIMIGSTKRKVKKRKRHELELSISCTKVNLFIIETVVWDLLRQNGYIPCEKDNNILK